MHEKTVTSTLRMFTIMIALVMTAALAEAQTKIKSGFNLFSAQQDVEIGQQSAAQAEAQLPLVTDRDVNEYVEQIGARLAAKAGGPQFRYQFRVVNASDINAFALPGGYVYINRGILEQSRNEGEVAGVIAHEIAHVALRHGTHQASKAYAAQAGLSILGGLLGGKGGDNTASILNAIGGAGLNVLFLKFTRELETQADVRGAQILAAAGYAPADMIGFFQTLAKADKSKKTTFLSSHPAPPDRIGRIEKEARLLSVQANPTQNVAELNQVKSRLNRLGTAPTMEQIASGAPAPAPASTSRRSRGTTQREVPAVAAPSTSMKSFTSRSGLYRIAHPSNWRVYEDSASAVTIVPEGGFGEIDGRTEVMYGAMVRHYDPFGARASTRRNLTGSVYDESVTLESATDDLLAQVQQGGRHLKVVRGSGQRIEVDAGRALAIALRGVNPATGIDERVTIVTRQLADEHLLYLLFVTPQAEAQQYSRVLQAMVNSMEIDEAHAH